MKLSFVKSYFVKYEKKIFYEKLSFTLDTQKRQFLVSYFVIYFYFPRVALSEYFIKYKLWKNKDCYKI